MNTGIRRRPPDWLGYLLGELMKPPAFLEATEQQQRSGHHEHTDSKETKDGHSEFHPYSTYDRHAYDEPQTRNRTQQSSTRTGNNRNITADKKAREAARPKTDTRSHSGTTRARRSDATSNQPRGDSDNLRSQSQSHTVESYRIHSVREPDPGLATSTLKQTHGAKSIKHSKNSSLLKSHREWQAALVHADIPPSVLDAYLWKINDIGRVQNILQVEADEGRFALKATHVSRNQVQFLDEVLSFAKKNGFSRYAGFAPSAEGEPYVAVDNRTFYATDWVPGTEVNFSSASQVGLVAQSLAELHEATIGFDPKGSNPQELHLVRLHRRRAEELAQLLSEVRRKEEHDEFDRQFLELASDLEHDAARSVELISQAKVAEFLKKARAYTGLCHLDVIPGNFIYSPDGSITILDFDLANFAPRVLDLAHLIRRSLQRTNYSSEAAYTSFVKYNDVRSMSQEEYMLIYALLTFPYRAWRIAHTRYRVFSEVSQVLDLNDYARQEPRRKAFLNAFQEQIDLEDKSE